MNVVASLLNSKTIKYSFVSHDQKFAFTVTFQPF